jgi:hypothetical protein
MKSIPKTVKVKEEYYIEFTDEELQALSMEKGQKFSCKIEDGGLRLEPFAKVELEIGSWDREVLLMLIEESCERDVSVNEVISDLLEKVIEDGNL